MKTKLLIFAGAFALAFNSNAQVGISPFDPANGGTYVGDFDVYMPGDVIPDISAFTEEGDLLLNDWSADDGSIVANLGGQPNFATTLLQGGQTITLISPEMNFGVNTGTPTVTFDYILEDGTVSVGLPGSVGTSSLEVMYKESSGGSWTSLATYTVVDNVWHTENISLAGASSYVTFYIGFKVTNVAAGSILPFSTPGIDEIIVEGNPPCIDVTGSTTLVECDTYTVPSGDETYTNTGIYKDTIPKISSCGDSVITIDLTVNYANTGTDVQIACGSFTWIDGNTYTTSTSSPTYMETNSDNCDSLVTLNLTINNVDTSVTSNDPTLTSNASGAAHKWLDCNNSYSQIMGETSASYAPATNGSYAVEVTENNCTDTSLCYTIATVGLVENAMSFVKLYPNPSNGQVNIDFGTITNSTIKIYSTDGRVVYVAEQNGKPSLSIEFNEPKGVYIVEVANNKEQITFRLIKE